MKIFHTGDIHYCPKHLDEVDRCFTYAVDKAIEQQCEIAVIAGDTFDSRMDLHHPAVAAVLKQVRRLTDVMPVLILQGTFSHDTPGSLEVFKTIGGPHPVYMADRICQVAYSKTGRWIESDSWAFDDLASIPEIGALFSCLPSVNKGAVAATDGTDNAGVAVGDRVFSLLKGWATSNLAARTAGIPTIVVTHGTVSESVSEHGVPMAGMDNEYSTGALFAAEASACFLNHIHKAQQWERNGRMIAYSGSVGRLHYGELDDKGVLIWNVTESGASSEFIKTPAKTLLQIEFDGPPDMDELRPLAKQAAGAYVRIRYSVDEDHKHSIDREAINELFANAEHLKLEGRINPVVRSRAEGMNKAQTLHEKLDKWAEVTGTGSEPLTERLAMLENMDPDEIVSELLNPKTKEAAA